MDIIPVVIFWYSSPQFRTFFGGFIVGDMVSRAIGNFYLKVSRPPLPARLFTNFEDAKSWLEQFKRKGD